MEAASAVEDAVLSAVEEAVLSAAEEEAVLHMRAHCNTRETVNHCRTIISSAYAEFSLSKDNKIDSSDYPTSIRNQQIEIIKFLERRYVFRYNEVMKYTEYRPNNTWVFDYQPVDQRVQNRMAIEARLEGINAWDKDITRNDYPHLHVTFVPYSRCSKEGL